MAKPPKVNSEDKVMDVSKPGKGKVIATSRPIVAPIATDNVNTESESPATPEEPASPLARTTTHKVIQPLSAEEKSDAGHPETDVAAEEAPAPSPETSEASPAETPPAPVAKTIPIASEDTAEDKLLKEVSAITAQDEPSKTAKTAPAKESETDSPVIEEQPVAEKPAETEHDSEFGDESANTPAESPAPETEAAETPEVKPESKDPKAKDEDPGKVPPPPASASDAAGVDVVADSVKSKKEATEKAEAQAKIDAELQGLIDSKKYIVPIGIEGGGKTAKHHSGKWIIIALVLIALIAGAYLAVDADIIENSVNLPVDLIK